MKSFLLFAVLFSSTLLSCGERNAGEAELTYQTQKQSLFEKEKSKPTRFLKLNYTFKKNLLGKTVVSGTVENTATVAAYRNIRLKLLYFNEGNLFENHEDVMTDALKPGEHIQFKLRYKLQKNADSVAVEVMRADVAD